MFSPWWGFCSEFVERYSDSAGTMPGEQAALLGTSGHPFRLRNRRGPIWLAAELRGVVVVVALALLELAAHGYQKADELVSEPLPDRVVDVLRDRLGEAQPIAHVRVERVVLPQLAELVEVV